MAKDLVLEVLKQIRDEAKKTNVRLERLEKGQTETNERLQKLEKGQAETNDRLETLEKGQAETNDRLADTEIRLATELVAVAGAVGQLKETLLQDRDLRQKVASHETRIAALERHDH
jgi:predicted  nucleic acid-binding Zn-ribbon protein